MGRVPTGRRKPAGRKAREPLGDSSSSASAPSPIAHRPLPSPGVRLQKVIADSGLTSRRKAEELIREGRVTVNGRLTRELGTRVDPKRDHVKVDGRHLKPAPPQVFVLLNKPSGYVSTMSDPAGRPTVHDLLAGVRVRLFPVGRLDFDGEGLMLLTNDGAMAQILLHPRYHVAKTYLIKVRGVLEDEEIKALSKGVELEDGRTAPAEVEKVGKAPQNSWLELTIYEGRKHQVKRMLEVVGHPVLRLKRVRFGPLFLGDLRPGRYRYLTDREANALRGLVKRRVGAAKDGQVASGKGRAVSGQRQSARGKGGGSHVPRRASGLSPSVSSTQSSGLRTPGPSPLASRPFQRVES